jgi:hypothetical protein
MELSFAPFSSADAKKTCYKVVEVQKSSGWGFNLGVVKGSKDKSSLTNDVYQKVDCK